ncbi:AAA family ATPase [Planomonospora parontospora]|uniref:AAA family ATPase n=1 Tax=Planomonospora parontospora TaxID=58119 RepID=UPI0016708FB3|nr:ATP-binding protein [Planomonospora parontospora]GGL53274.1 ATPase AAA [Planomonospora parontospora subsp. antibiotica]GII19529.1 ATPase AAA [Planomonospora parontospora subsp. antibiotica]
MDKPAEMFDRDYEWAELTRFVRHPGPEATLGVVSGRRRQGKTFLLDAVCRAAGGFYFAATEATEAESLHQFGTALARHLGEPAPRRFAHWDEAVETLMAIAGSGPVPVVIDEFPYLVKASPQLPSLIQRALGPQGQRRSGAVRLLLCGSALSFMGALLAGTAPLRGRASLELVVPTLDYRQARDFWDITDPALALLVNAVVGGTPAYRREFTLGDSPDGIDDFGPWVIRNVLNPGRPLFREARFLLAEEPELRDTALYHGVLSAIAGGNHTRGGIAGYLGRKSTDLGHALTVLEDVGMIAREADAFHGKRSAYRITEPILGFYHAIMRPEWTDLERPGYAAQVWERSQAAFRSKILGPHFEHLARAWTRWHAGPETLGGLRTRVVSGVLPDPVGKTGHELDVVVFGRADDGRESILAIGEAKYGDVVGQGHLERLEHLRELLVRRDDRAGPGTRLLLFSAAGFMPGLREVARAREDVQLVGLDRLYEGS